VTNLSRPDETHQITLTVRIATTTPCLVEQVMRTVLESSTRIVKDPSPMVALKAIDAAAIEVELLFRVESPAGWTAARNEIIDLLYSQCRADGLVLAAPAGGLVFAPVAANMLLEVAGRSSHEMADTQ